MKFIRTLLLVAFPLLLAATPQSTPAAEAYTVHEWGTFTVLQNEQGDCLPGVNVNEERLPPFVHRLWDGAARDGGILAPVARTRSKGIPARYVNATMRMETPVIYIYPPKDRPSEPLDVQVQFRGGWISEWYPQAQVTAPGLVDRNTFLGQLAADQTGEIKWSALKVGTEGKAPETDDHVWLAPRIDSAAMIESSDGETENYLFYRGIAALEAPVRVVRDSDRNQLTVKANDVAGSSREDMNQFWLVDVRSDGAVAYRHIEPTAEQCKSGTFATLPAEFGESDYAVSNLAKLRASMKTVLVEEGLFADEAEAMLETWELSYFKSYGLRLFFTLPRKWTDHVLPLSLSQKADIQRVMIGRVEIVTPEQRNLITALRKTETSSPSWLWSQLEQMPPEQQRAFWSHKDQVHFPFEQYGVEVPQDYQHYADLGRFRDALVLHALDTDDTGNLRQFVQQYRLQDGFRIIDGSE